MTEFVYIKHPDVASLGGPVARHTLPYWESKGWAEAGDAGETEQQVAVETETSLTASDVDALKRGDLNELALLRGVDPTQHDNMESLRDAVKATL